MAGFYAANMAQPTRNSVEGRSLYVGNLDPKVTDGLLWEVFSTVGAVESCKVLHDKNGESAGYGFVDFMFPEEADRALQVLNGRKIYNKEIKVNWAAHATSKEDTSNHHNVFVGDLSSEITDDLLHKAFAGFGSITDARVMWDQNTGRSRGYGFVAFRDRRDAERAITEMNGVWLGNRTIRCNWANQKLNASTNASVSSYEEVSGQASTSNTTVYVGNLGPDATEEILGSCFQNFGIIEEVRIQKDKGFGFVKYQNHDQATRAIIAMNGTVIGTRPVRCSWGKERANSTNPSHPPQAYNYYPPYGSMPQNYMYNMPYTYGEQPFYSPQYGAYDHYAYYAHYQAQNPQG